jgi:hypothetical protein
VLHDALHAAAEGRATLRQKFFLERYERVKLAEEERIRNRGIMKKTMDYMFPGIMTAATEATVLAQLDDELYDELSKLEPGTLDKPAPDVAIPEGLKRSAGGPLDQAAQSIADNTEQSAKSWTSWLGWR